MQIEIRESHRIREQATAAGFASLEGYASVLLGRDAERVAIRAGLNAMGAGHVRPFEEFDREFRVQNGLSGDE